MSKSIPRDICWTARELHDREFGGQYWITARDMKEAKDFLVANGGEIPDPDTIISFAKNYFSSNFQGWQEQNYPLWGLWRNWNSFAPKQARPKKAKPNKTIVMIRCSDCGSEHNSDTVCPKCFEPV